MKTLQGAVNLCTPVSGRLQGWGLPPTFPFHLLQAEEPPEKISYENVPKESSKLQGCSPHARLPWIPAKVTEDRRRSSKRWTWEDSQHFLESRAGTWCCASASSKLTHAILPVTP